MMRAGLLITLEGGEGVGKSTALSFIHDFLIDQNIDCVVTREPGGTKIGESIRHILLHQADVKMCAEAELLLMFAARAEHIAHVIRPALAKGQCIISDRYTDASFAYQGGGRGVSKDFISQLAYYVQSDCIPDLTILLDAPVSVGLSRMQQRGKRDRIEQEDVAFFERVRQAYLDRAKNEPNRFCVIDASQPIEKVQADIAMTLKTFFSERQIT